SERDRRIRAFETYSPAEFLEQSAGGAQPAPADLKVVEEVMLEQKLPAGVINVLLDFVLKKNNMKLSRNYITKVAGQWARKNIQTVTEAMEIAIKENEANKAFHEQKTKRPKAKPGKRNPRQDKLPKWMTEDKN